MALKRSSAEVLESSALSRANSRSHAATRARSSAVPKPVCRRASITAWFIRGARWRSSAQRPDVGGVLFRPAREHRRDGDQRVGAGGAAALGRLRIDAAVDLEIDRLAQGVDRAAQRGDLGELGVDEGLAAE